MKYISAAESAEIIADRTGIPLSELVDIFADIPAKDTVDYAYTQGYTQALLDLLPAMTSIMVDMRLHKMTVNAKSMRLYLRTYILHRQAIRDGSGFIRVEGRGKDAKFCFYREEGVKNESE